MKRIRASHIACSFILYFFSSADASFSRKLKPNMDTNIGYGMKCSDAMHKVSISALVYVSVS